MKEARRHLPWLLVALVFFLTVTVPSLFRLFNRSDVWVLGMPLVLFWIVTVCLAFCIILFLMWRRDEAREGK